MEAKCPHCGQIREYDENAVSNPNTPPCCNMAGVSGPATPFAESLAAGTGPASTATEETAEQQAGDQTAPGGFGSSIPWEQRRGFLDFQAYWQTTRGILFHPAQSFAQWNPPVEMEGALLFLVTFGSLGQILAQYWVMFLRDTMTTSAGVAQDWFGFSLFILKAPFLVLLSTLISAAVIHFFLFLLRSDIGKVEQDLCTLCLPLRRLGLPAAHPRRRFVPCPHLGFGVRRLRPARTAPHHYLARHYGLFPAAHHHADLVVLPDVADCRRRTGCAAGFSWVVSHPDPSQPPTVELSRPSPRARIMSLTLRRVSPTVNATKEGYGRTLMRLSPVPVASGAVGKYRWMDGLSSVGVRVRSSFYEMNVEFTLERENER